MLMLWTKAWRRFRRDGLAAMWRAAVDKLEDRFSRWRDGRLDRRIGIDTCGIQDDLASLGARGEHLENGQGYQPIQISVFRQIVRTMPIAPKDYYFIDYGSGKARALILAAEAKFQRMIGVEFAPGLHAAALKNVTIYHQWRKGAGPIELICGDASEFVLPGCKAVLFFYNPFDGLVMEKVLARIEQGWRERGHDWLVVYRNPRHADLLDRKPFLTLIAEHPAFRIYRTRSRPAGYRNS